MITASKILRPSGHRVGHKVRTQSSNPSNNNRNALFERKRFQYHPHFLNYVILCQDFNLFHQYDALQVDKNVNFLS